MTVKVSCIGLKGLEGYRVQAEVQISPGMNSMVIVGLPDASVIGTRGQAPCPNLHESYSIK
ncbi:hypothetical protein GCM10009865_53050 [Aeromicrobium ponti]|uniref:hypothetical protein n=1 Tax=Cytobacillus oceanisediminis TaxID=665099 RepID=UPI00119D8FA0